MRISVFGATGMAGSVIVTEALRRGHAVTAISRNADGLVPHDHLDVHRVDVTGTDDLDPVLSGSDVAVLAIRLAPGDESLLRPATIRVLDAAARTGTRTIVIGGAAPLRSPNHPGRLVADDPAYVPTQWKPSAQASLDQFHACQQHPSGQWVYFSPPAILEPGPRNGTYRRGTTQLLTGQDGTSRITAADLAVAVIDEIETPAEHRHVTVVGAP